MEGAADVRHGRAAIFAQAVARAREHAGGTRRWTEVAHDPNDPAAVAVRAEVLRAAWRPPVRDRTAMLEARVAGKRVLDVGCVAHDAARMQSPQWLHGRLAAASAECIGVDILDDGIAAMRRLGYDAVAHDLSTGLGPLRSRGPFDVVVAGELIEHVEVLSMLFRTAAEALAPDGEMIVSTPNPYAPHRVRAAQLGIVWENVDHVLYAFPSGMAELCERHGLVLAEAMVTARPPAPPLADLPKRLSRRMQGRQWATVGVATIGPRAVRRVEFGPIGRAARGLSWPKRQFTGETFIYVIRPRRTIVPDA
jgi:2-polyprenyl-3-methyl-5-hydroxy-6-metoxy-1,4-benzoquinol methylase